MLTVHSYCQSRGASPHARKGVADDKAVSLGAADMEKVMGTAERSRWRSESEAVLNVGCGAEDVLLMVPLRLGLDCINACYTSSLKVL